MKIICAYILATVSSQMTFSGLNAQPKPSIYEKWEDGFTITLKNTHDLALPAWGPYSNQYNGISHVPAKNNGLRFDVVVQPSLYMRTLTSLANVKRESGYHPWQANPDLSYFSYRYELEWKDQVFCDISFSKVDEQSRLIKAEFVNNTEYNRSLALNIFNTIAFPYNKKISAGLPAHVNWKKASDYSSFTDSAISGNYNLVYNGQLRGQVDDENTVSGTAVIIGKRKGEKLTCLIANNRKLSNGLILIRYRTISGNNTVLHAGLNGKVLKTTELPYKKEYSLAYIKADNLCKRDINLMLEISNNTSIRLDGFALIDESELASINFTDTKLNYIPDQINCGIPNGIILKYQDIEEYYGIIWSDLKADKRELFDDNPDRLLAVFNHLVKKEEGNAETVRISGNNKGWFKNIFSTPIILKPHQKTSMYAYLVYGNNAQEVTARLNNLNKSWQNAEISYKNQQSKVGHSNDNEAGKPYQLSQQLMEATTLTNLIYPTFTVNQFVKHTTPGKRWSALYTWDSGFIGLGYAALNAGRAAELLNAYTMDNTAQSAFLEHGTPLPVQGYLFNELWSQTQNIEYLKYFYPRLKRYYDFLGGAESSPTRKLKSNLIKTWDIFYNSGGWDDYSPQVFVHKKKLEESVAPTVNTSHQIRFAKMLKMAAWQLGYQQDILKYDADIDIYTKALQENAWDNKSGYYGYVEHDANGNAIGILHSSDGGNFNKGIDGCSPLIAGICDPNQQVQIMKHLFTMGELWTDHGITAIDQTASYYNKDGYWNGRVWMPHQWFFWKTMLDLNEPEKAVQIAKTALDVWKRETDDSYNCWENFSVESGNGGGWHQFGALSSPVLNWYSALYKPGTLTAGFNVWPIAQKFNLHNNGFKGEFKLFSDRNGKTTTLLLCLDDKSNYEAKCNGKSIILNKVFNGLYFIKVALAESEKDIFRLEVKEIDNARL